MDKLALVGRSLAPVAMLAGLVGILSEAALPYAAAVFVACWLAGSVTSLQRRGSPILPEMYLQTAGSWLAGASLVAGIQAATGSRVQMTIAIACGVGCMMVALLITTIVGVRRAASQKRDG